MILKKTIIAAVSAVAIVSAFPLNAFAQSPDIAGISASVTVADVSYEYELDADGNAVLTSCSSDAKFMMIPDTVGGHKVTEIGENCFKGLDSTVSVSLPDTVTKVGAGSFSACPELTSVTIGKGVVSIGEKAFAGCPKLVSFSVIAENTQFASLDSMLVSKDMKTLIRYAGSSSAVVPEGIENIGDEAFFGRKDITLLALPAGLLTVGDYAFAGCLSLKNAALPDSVKTLGKGAFMNCSALQTVNFAAVEEIPENCCSMCSELLPFVIPDNVKKIGKSAFFGCSGLSGIYIRASVSEIGEDAFGRIYSLRTGAVTNITDFSIRGTKGSAAEKYAESCGLSFTGDDGYILGDVNFDTKIDGRDATIVLMEYANLSSETGRTFDDEQQLAGDFNKDSKIDGRDATMILVEYARLS